MAHPETFPAGRSHAPEAPVRMTTPEGPVNIGDGADVGNNRRVTYKKLARVLARTEPRLDLGIPDIRREEPSLPHAPVIDGALEKAEAAEELPERDPEETVN